MNYIRIYITIFITWVRLGLSVVVEVKVLCCLFECLFVLWAGVLFLTFNLKTFGLLFLLTLHFHEIKLLHFDLFMAGFNLICLF